MLKTCFLFFFFKSSINVVEGSVTEILLSMTAIESYKT